MPPATVLLAGWLCTASAAPALAPRAAAAALPDLDDAAAPGPRLRAPAAKAGDAPSRKQVTELAAAIWLALALLMGGLWVSKGRAFARGALVGLFASPLVAFLLYLSLEPAFDDELGASASGGEGSTVCPECGGLLERGEALCPACGRAQP